MLQINIASLKPGVHHFELKPTIEALDLDPETFADVAVAARLDVQGSRVLVLLQASAQATLTCDRTLVRFQQPVEGTFTLLFAPPEMAQDLDEEDDNLRVLYPSDQEIDLTDAVRDTLMLALPVRRIAPGAEDADLPMQFGSADDAEGDPRWEALRALRPSDGLN